MKISDAAKRLEVSPGQVRALIQRGLLGRYIHRPGMRALYIVTRDQVEDFLAGRDSSEPAEYDVDLSWVEDAKTRSRATGS